MSHATNGLESYSEVPLKLKETWKILCLTFAGWESKGK
jgi:hypothetical protein